MNSPLTATSTRTTSAVVTSSGQTCHEARVVGRWLVILDVVPGHGRENTLHELERGGALACSPDPDSAEAAVRFIFAEQPEQPPWPVESASEWQKHFLGALNRVGFDPSAQLGPSIAANRDALTAPAEGTPTEGR